MSTADTAARSAATASLASAFLALVDTGAAPPPTRRGRRAAALLAVVALVLAGPLPAAGLAAADADDRTATLPAKIWAGEGDEDDADDA